MKSAAEIQASLTTFRATLPQDVHLVAVSKYHDQHSIKAAYECGQRMFGESHVQELVPKAKELPTDIEWHFIGHLQTNKVKYIAPFISLIQSVDSLKLLQEIEKQGSRFNRTIDILLELHLAKEQSKTGLTSDACMQLLESGVWREMQHVRIRGLMMMASFTDDKKQIAREMSQAHDLFIRIKSQFFSKDSSFSLCSWGMSDDYPIAIAHGANIVRIGTAIFGDRQY